MATRTCKFTRLLASAALAGVIAGCGDDGGSFRVFLGFLGSGRYSSVEAQIPLERAVLAGPARNECRLRGDLEDECDATFQVVEDVLVVSVSDCTIDDLVNLFSCAFETANPESLERLTSVDVTCADGPSSCDRSPDACIAADSAAC